MRCASPITRSWNWNGCSRSGGSKRKGLSPSLLQDLDRRGVVAPLAMPAVLGAMIRPPERRGAEIVVGAIEQSPAGALVHVVKNEPHLFRVAEPGGPVKRGRAVL